jgi:hypothetical protein
MEHVLALTALYKLQSTREARVASLSVSRSDLPTAAFADVLARFISGNARNSNPIGIPAAAKTAPPNAMAEKIVAQRTPGGQPRYQHGINKLNDTADVAALIRNGISAQQPGSGAVVVAGPLSNVAASLALPDVAPLVTQRVRALVLSANADDLRVDLAAARKVLSSWPAPIVMVDAPAVLFPGAQLESRFAWSPNHPVREAYQLSQTMPYDEPLQSAVAALYAVRGQSDLFELSGPGTIEILDDGRTRFTASANGKHKMLRIAAGKQEETVQTLVELITSQPAAPGAGRGKGKQA